MCNRNDVIPLIGVRDVLLNSPLRALTALGYFEDRLLYNEIINWHTWTKNDGLDIYVKDDVVICIACLSNCYLNGLNLLGLSSSELVGLLGAPAEIGDAIWLDDERSQIPFEYPSIGLQVWFEYDKVEKVYCDGGSQE